LAEQTGVALSTLQRIGRGGNLTLENLLKIARELKIDPSTLFVSPEKKGEITGLQKKFCEDMNEFFNEYFKESH